MANGKRKKFCRKFTASPASNAIPQSSANFGYNGYFGYFGQSAGTGLAPREDRTFLFHISYFIFHISLCLSRHAMYCALSVFFPHHGGACEAASYAGGTLHAASAALHVLQARFIAKPSLPASPGTAPRTHYEY